jgi:hypothetical protein
MVVAFDVRRFHPLYRDLANLLMNFILEQCFIAVSFWGALLEALFHPFSQISFMCCSFFSPTFGLSLYIY